jgi:mRNA interferase HigB
VRVIAKTVLREFWEGGHPEARDALEVWFKTVERAKWQTMADLRESFPTANVVGDRVVFDVYRNRFRIVAVVDLKLHGVLIRFVGTHADYDRIDVRTV